jgi:chromosome segregation ATPase
MSEITDLKKAIDDIRESINTDRTWREEFKAGFKESNNHIKDLGIALENIARKLGEEIDERKGSNATLGTWREEFKSGLKENNDQIRNLNIALENIARKLGEEIDERKGLGATLGNITNGLGKNVTKLKMQIAVIKGIGIVLSAFFGGGVISLIAMYLAGILKFGQ